LFATTPAQSSVLDIGCGRGAVLQLATTYGDRATRLVGVDAAQIHDRAGQGPAPFELIGRTKAEDLPFPDLSFDLVVSQFGLEYADPRKALGEALRVCRSEFLFLLHTEKSAIVADGKREAAMARWITGELDLFGKLETWLERGLATDADALREALDRLEDKARGLPNPRLAQTMHQAVCSLANAGASASSNTRPIARDIERRLQNHTARMVALGEAAARADGFENDFGDIAQANGFSMQVRPLTAPGTETVLGRWVAGRRHNATNIEKRGRA
jgi:SAM-dependent methyltransferase